MISELRLQEGIDIRMKLKDGIIFITSESTVEQSEDEKTLAVLTKEAESRGLVDGVRFKRGSDKVWIPSRIVNYPLHLNSFGELLDRVNQVIYDGMHWGKPIPPEPVFDPKKLKVGDVAVDELEYTLLVTSAINSAGLYKCCYADKDGKPHIQHLSYNNIASFATDEQKAKLFRDMEAHGVKWNPETEKVEGIQWVPKVGEAFFTIYYGEAAYDIYVDNKYGKAIIDSGLYWRTEEEADEAIEKIKKFNKSLKGKL